MMQELIAQSQRELVELVNAWFKAGVTGRAELQKALFPDGLVWSHEQGFLNSKNEGLMSDWHEFFQSLTDSRADLNSFFVLFGVPTNNRFEHLTATIEAAIPLYDLCASVLA